jgi:hypothetical protein
MLRRETDMSIETITFRISRKWWGNFASETIIEDALGTDPTDPNADEYLVDTRALYEHVEANGRRTKAEIVIDLTPLDLATLASHAKWYGYFWGEEMAAEAWDIGDRGAWASRGRSSLSLYRKAKAILDTL